MKQASRDTGPMRGCAHRGFVSRPALVQPPRMRVGLKSHSRHGGPNASMERKLCQREMAPIDGRRPRSGKQLLSRSIGITGLGSYCPGGPTRRRETGPTKTGAGEATGVSEVGHIGRVGG